MQYLHLNSLTLYKLANTTAASTISPNYNPTLPRFLISTEINLSPEHTDLTNLCLPPYNHLSETIANTDSKKRPRDTQGPGKCSGFVRQEPATLTRPITVQAGGTCPWTTVAAHHTCFLALCPYILNGAGGSRVAGPLRKRAAAERS